jgi:hypothetical protein
VTDDDIGLKVLRDAPADAADIIEYVTPAMLSRLAFY